MFPVMRFALQSLLGPSRMFDARWIFEAELPGPRHKAGQQSTSGYLPPNSIESSVEPIFPSVAFLTGMYCQN